MSTAEQDMLDLFVQESSEHLGTLETGLLELEGNPRDPALLNQLFRAVHSVKGTAGFFGLTAITELAHVMESVMALMRDGKMVADSEMVNLFLTATDKLKAMVGAPGSSSQIDTRTEREALHALLRADPPVAATAPELPVYLRSFRIDPELVRHALRHGQNIFVVQIRLQADIEAKGQTILDYFRDVESLGTFIDSATDIGQVEGLSDSSTVEIVCSVLFATPMETDLLLGAFDLPGEQLVRVPKDLLGTWLKAQPSLAPSAAATKPPEPIVTPPAPTPAPAMPAPAPAAVPAVVPPSVPAVPAATTVAKAPEPGPTGVAHPMPASSPTTHSRAEETVRISVSTLDALMNLAGEMVLGRNQLLRLSSANSRESGHAQDGLSAIVQGISGVTSDLQRTVMRARLQPVGGLFNKFVRVVRDLGQKLGKDIHLETAGDDVELDRAIIEGLSDPLTHLVRNSADHGIEPPDERRRLGKPPSGCVRISAAHLAGRVQIEVRDDGRGLDPARLKAKAIEKGLITAEQAARMGDIEAWQLIFAPGFSTAAVLSDVSGRGVGMDVVKTNIERLGGRVEIQSELGHGAAIIIRLPLTLAIIPALVVVCAERRFAVPQINLEEIVRPDTDRPLEDVGGAKVIRLRNELIPVLDLADLLNLPPFATAEKPGYILILQLDGRRFGLQVEEVSDTEEIVVKPLGRHLQGVPFYSGSTLLGQGEIALILDPAGIAAGRLPLESQTLRGAIAAESTTTSLVERVLLFQDGSPEMFALHVANIGRIEKIPVTRIERIGGHDYLRQANGPTLRILRLSDHLPVAPNPDQPAEIHIIVPRLVGHPVGLLASSIIDTVDLPEGGLDTHSLSAAGLLGTASLRDRLCLVLDLYGLLASAGIVVQKAALPSSRDLTSLRVLLAEDTAFFREAVRRGLDGMVGELEIAVDGEDAWQRLQVGAYDVVITDIEMPRLNGFELTSRIRADGRLHDLPVIALSARGSEDFRSRAQTAGVNLYETKFDRERLRLALTRVVSGGAH